MSYIRTERDYKDAVERLAQMRVDEPAYLDQLASMGLSQEQIEMYVAPGRSIREQLEADVAWYERARRGEFEVATSMEQVGQILIALRIWKGWTVSDLAKQLGVSRASVSHDELSEYYGITKERLQRLFDVFGARIKLAIDREGEQKASWEEHLVVETETAQTTGRISAPSHGSAGKPSVRKTGRKAA